MSKQLVWGSMRWHEIKLGHEIRTFARKEIAYGPAGQPFRWNAWRVCSCGLSEDAGGGYCWS